MAQSNPLDDKNQERLRAESDQMMAGDREGAHSHSRRRAWLGSIQQDVDSSPLSSHMQETVDSWKPQHQVGESADIMTAQQQDQEKSLPKNLQVTEADFQDVPAARSASGIYTSSAQPQHGEYFRYRTMVVFLANRVSASGWMPQPALLDPLYRLGVLLRQTGGQYSFYPDNIHRPLLNAVQRLDVGVAVAMRPEMLTGILARLAPEQTELQMLDGSRMQIIESFSAITASNVNKDHNSCVLRDEEVLLVWQDDLQLILEHAQRTEERLLAYVWGSTAIPTGFPTRSAPFYSPSSSVSKPEQSK